MVVGRAGFANLLWKQLDHHGDAGFDPTLFRVDAYRNVLYLHANSALPLACDVHHWFPCASKKDFTTCSLLVLNLPHVSEL